MNKKKLTPREKELLVIAVDLLEENKKEKGYYQALQDEYKKIVDKLRYDETALGNQLLRGFSMAGCSGTEYDLMGALFKKGFKELYCSAPYYWGVVNPETMEIYSYTEGDTALTRCKTKKKFVEEIKGYIGFLKESGQANTSEAELILKEVNKSV
jgi:hypothetical protein